MSLPRLRLSKKTAPQSVNEKQSSLVRYQQYFINELSLLRNFCHKCQKPLFYTLCLLRHRSLPYHCTVYFAIPRLRPFSFVCQRVDFIDTLNYIAVQLFCCMKICIFRSVFRDNYCDWGIVGTIEKVVGNNCIFFVVKSFQIFHHSLFFFRTRIFAVIDGDGNKTFFGY